MAEDQRDVVAFLADPVSYGSGIDKVERLETHVSLVFLAGERAYKMKRAVTYPYLDFSTLERRRQACEAELALNRRTAPELYLETRPIRRGAGGLGWDGDGDVVDWVVVMRRFDQHRRLDAVAAAGGLEQRLLYALAAHIADFHAKAAKRPDFGGAAGLAAVVRENDDCLRQIGGPVFASDRIDELGDRSEQWLRRLSPLLDRRRADGKVRRCHGDLHLRNICVVDDRPMLFDCIEFSEAFASIDVLYDLAFLLMDLAHQGQPQAANLMFNRYLDLSGDDEGLAAMPLFIATRAAIRAHVTATAGGEGAAEAARSYLDQACATLRPAPPRLLAIGGLSGTGKSTVAAALAPELGLRLGARVLRSDVLRKRLFGADPEARLSESHYTEEVTARVYAALCDHAAVALNAGYCAIIDAVALRPEERRAFAAAAEQAGVSFTGFWLEASAPMLAARVGARRHDASDATPAIVEHQLQFDAGPLDWQRIDAGGSAAATLTAMRKALA